MTQLSCRRTGDGPPVVLLHPVGLDGSFWGDLPDRLAATHSVASVDLAGHGASPPAPRPGRMDFHVAAVAATIESLGLGPATLVGVSFGGMIAQNLALSRPDLVAGLVLAGCPGAIPAEARSAILKRGGDAEAGGMAAVVEPTLERWFTPGFLSTDAVARVRQRLLGDRPADWAGTWEAVAGHDALARLGRIAVPALVIGGDVDAATPLPAKRALAVAIPGSRLAVLAGAPHMMQIECPDAFAAEVVAFVTSPRGGTRT